MVAMFCGSLPALQLLAMGEVEAVGFIEPGVGRAMTLRIIALAMSPTTHPMSL